MSNTRTRRLSSLKLVGFLFSCFASAALGACDKDESLEKEQGARPPPVASSRPHACSSGGGVVKDSVSANYFPRVGGSYCIDPHGETRAYGESASGTVDQVCTELFDGECEVYKRHGLERVVTLRYVDGKGSPGTVAVNLSRFKEKEGAYSFFTKRVIADSDPAELSLTDLKGPGAGAMGTGIAYVWRGNHVAELSYTNELESPDQLKASSQQALPPLAKAIAERLPGEPSYPAAVRALPEEHRLPLGVSYVKDDVLDVAGTGPGAIGYYRQDAKRWRVFSIARPDADSAKDVMLTLKKLEGAKSVKPPPIEALIVSRRELEDGPSVEWAVARNEATVIGVGDEIAVLGDSEEQNAKQRLPREQKLERLKALLEAPAP
jgi:hypothetical protein